MWRVAGALRHSPATAAAARSSRRCAATLLACRMMRPSLSTAPIASTSALRIRTLATAAARQQPDTTAAASANSRRSTATVDATAEEEDDSFFTHSAAERRMRREAREREARMAERDEEEGDEPEAKAASKKKSAAGAASEIDPDTRFDQGLTPGVHSKELIDLMYRLDDLRVEAFAAAQAVPASESVWSSAAWQRARDQSDELLRRVFAIESALPTLKENRLTHRAFKNLFLRIKSLQLYEHAFPFFQLFQLHLQLHWREANNEDAYSHFQRGDAPSSHDLHVRARKLGMSRVSRRLVGLILDCICASPEHGPHIAQSALEWMVAHDVHFEIEASHYRLVHLALIDVPEGAQISAHRLTQARAFFDTIPREKRQYWTYKSMMRTYCEAGQPTKAIEILREVEEDLAAGVREPPSDIPQPPLANLRVEAPIIILQAMLRTEMRDLVATRAYVDSLPQEARRHPRIIQMVRVLESLEKHAAKARDAPNKSAQPWKTIKEERKKQEEEKRRVQKEIEKSIRQNKAAEASATTPTKPQASTVNQRLASLRQQLANGIAQGMETDELYLEAEAIWREALDAYRQVDPRRLVHWRAQVPTMEANTNANEPKPEATSDETAATNHDTTEAPTTDAPVDLSLVADASTTTAMIQIQHLVPEGAIRNLDYIVYVLSETFRAEMAQEANWQRVQQVEQSHQDDAAPESSAPSTSTPSLLPSLLSPAAFSQAFYAMSLTDPSFLFRDLADRVWRIACERAHRRRERQFDFANDANDAAATDLSDDVIFSTANIQSLPQEILEGYLKYLSRSLQSRKLLDLHMRLARRQRLMEPRYWRAMIDALDVKPSEPGRGDVDSESAKPNFALIEEIIHEFEAAGGVWRLDFFNVYLGVYAKQGDLAQVKRLVQKMFDVNLAPDRGTYARIIQATMLDAIRRQKALPADAVDEWHAIFDEATRTIREHLDAVKALGQPGGNPADAIRFGAPEYSMLLEDLAHLTRFEQGEHATRQTADVQLTPDEHENARQTLEQSQRLFVRYAPWVRFFYGQILQRNLRGEVVRIVGRLEPFLKEMCRQAQKETFTSVDSPYDPLARASSSDTPDAPTPSSDDAPVSLSDLQSHVSPRRARAAVDQYAHTYSSLTVVDGVVTKRPIQEPWRWRRQVQRREKQRNEDRWANLTEEEKAEERKQALKKRPCFELAEKGTCSRGDACPFSHDSAILTDAHDAKWRADKKKGLKEQEVVAKQRSQPCFDLVNTGTCSRGDACPFSHDPAVYAELRAKLKLKWKAERQAAKAKAATTSEAQAPKQQSEVAEPS